MKDKLRELVSELIAPESRNNTSYQEGREDARHSIADRLEEILDAEEGGYWPDGSDAPIRDYTSAQPTELEDAVLATSPKVQP